MNSQLRVLVVDDNPDFKTLISLNIQKLHSVVPVEVGSLDEATSAVYSQYFDIVFFGHKDWEEGILLYSWMLSEGQTCQFILFMNDPAELKPEFDQQFKAVMKPDYKKLIASADWSVDSL
jgi:hypothetical protein